MNKSNAVIFLVLSILSFVAGFLLSSISFVGKIGIGLFYHQYKFLKVWWKGGLLVLLIWLFVWLIQSIYVRKLQPGKKRLVHSIFLLCALIGLLFSYNDFRNTLSHRWLGERFHLGVYLFWVVWILITVYYWLAPSNKTANVTNTSFNPYSDR